MNKYMEEAIKEALNGIKNNHGGPFGAVIVKDNVIIGRAQPCLSQSRSDVSW